MDDKTKEERDTVLIKIMEGPIKNTVETDRPDGKYSLQIYYYMSFTSIKYQIFKLVVLLSKRLVWIFPLSYVENH